MRPSPRIRRLAAVLVVVFLLTTLWAAYYLYAETHPSGGSPSGRAIAAYSQSSAGSFAAAVRPSYLYNNSTEVFGGNLTLFSPITSWINASIAYTLEVNRTAAVSLVETFSVTLSTSVWSKTLFTAVNSTSVPATTLATLDLRYAINVSSVVALAKTIDTQVGYFGSGYTLSLVPVIAGTVEVAGVEQSISSQPQLNFTFSGSLITPTGLAYASAGALLSPASPTTAGGITAIAPYVALIGSVGGLGGSAWVVTRRAEEAGVPPLEDLIRPYEEAIAVIATAPNEATATAVVAFADLVKIADTLGKPILRPAGPDSARQTFFVLDGPVAYRYRYPGDGAISGSIESFPTSPSGPGLPPSTATLVQRLQLEIKQLHGLPPDGAMASEARRRVSRALGLIRAGADAEAAVEIEEISRILAAAPAPEDSRRGP